jgi:hypothetical protein
VGVGALCVGVVWVCLPGVKQPGHEADLHLPRSRMVEPHPTLRFVAMVWCLINQAQGQLHPF